MWARHQQAERVIETRANLLRFTLHKAFLKKQGGSEWRLEEFGIEPAPAAAAPQPKKAWEPTQTPEQMRATLYAIAGRKPKKAVNHG